LLAPHPENADDRILVQTNTNIGQVQLAIGFRLAQSSITRFDPRKGRMVVSKDKTVRISEWFECERNYKEQDVLQSKPISKLDLTIEWLRNLLKQGPQFAHQVRGLAKERDFSWRTVEQAKKLLRVHSERKPWNRPGPGSHSEWSLPAQGLRNAEQD
jgi:hypothetical protein